ncbi:MAG: L,D-transpeptidase family protein [Pseudomonadota bacterium]
MRISRFLMVGLVLVLTACSSSKFKTYYGPEVTKILVDKSKRVMVLMHNTQVLKRYNVELGFTSKGHKRFEGDGKTPEGTYYIDRRNPRSSFHLSLGISYPNRADRAFAKSQGKSPGGDIFIHGQPNAFTPRRSDDWTAGCIAVTNKQMERIYAMVKTGTEIVIKP